MSKNLKSRDITFNAQSLCGGKFFKVGGRELLTVDQHVKTMCWKHSIRGWEGVNIYMFLRKMT
jgi:hypothetical protein